MQCVLLNQQKTPGVLKYNFLKEIIIPMNLQIFIKMAPTNMIQLNDCAYRIMNVNPFVCLRFHKFSINE